MYNSSSRPLSNFTNTFNDSTESTNSLSKSLSNSFPKFSNESTSNLTNSTSSTSDLTDSPTIFTFKNIALIFFVLFIVIGGIIYLAKDTELFEYTNRAVRKIIYLIKDKLGLEPKPHEKIVNEVVPTPIQPIVPIPSKNDMQKQHLDKVLNEATVESSVPLGLDTDKSGWCYVGQERGFRSCIEVGDQDKCMSGNIFPSQDICINPSLRS